MPQRRWWQIAPLGHPLVRGAGNQRAHCRRCGCYLLGGLRGEEEEKKEKKKEGAEDNQSIVTTPSVCENWGVDDGRLNNLGLFLFLPIYLIGP